MGGGLISFPLATRIFQNAIFQVNISPSLHSSSSLDLDVKSPLTTEVFNMARYHIPNRIKTLQQVGYLKDL